MSSKTGVGRALRDARVARQMSLSEVATKAAVSVATLSRIENEKQSIDVALLIELAGIVGVGAATLLSGDGNGEDLTPNALARELAMRSPAERAEIIARTTEQDRNAKRRDGVHAQIENAVATVDLMIEEIRDLKKQSRKR